MGFLTLLVHLCTLCQFIMLLVRHWKFVETLWELPYKDVVLGWVVGIPIVGLVVVAAYYLLAGLFALFALLPTFFVALLMAVLSFSLLYFVFISQVRDHQHCYEGGGTGRTPQKLTARRFFALVVAFNLFSGLSLGTIVAIVVCVCVVAFTYIEHENYCDGQQNWNPQLNPELFCIMLLYYYSLSGVFALLLAIHPFLGLSSETFFTFAVVLLLVAKYGICGRLSWLDVQPLVFGAVVIYVLWKVLFALAVAISLPAWMSSERLFKLVAASFIMLDPYLDLFF